ncbi:TolC family protein [Spirosoma panaciterrae]|uniref:TolC family protein n=1 Tax=Spirosoma panaciterrae TaxID=496058 RepID=UPI001469C1EA|nr:TolC family protein [Spirosoma panaciterrae]
MKWRKQCANSHSKHSFFGLLVIQLLIGGLNRAVLLGQSLSLVQCQEYAIRSSLDVQKAGLRVETDRINAQLTHQAGLPSWGLSLSEGVNLGHTIDPFSNTFLQETIHSGTLGLSSSVMLFNGFRQKYQEQQQLFTRRADEATLQQQKLELRRQVTAAYMQLLLSQELLQLATEQRQFVVVQLNRAKALVQEGVLPKIGLTDWEAQLATADYEVLTARANLQQNRLALQWVMNWRESSDLSIESIAVPEPQPPTALTTWIDELPSRISRHPAVQSAEWQLKSAQTGYAIAKSGLYPSIALGIGINTAYSSVAPPDLIAFGRQLQYNLGQYIRLNVSFPTTSFRTTQLQMALAEVNRKSTALDIQKARLQVNQTLEQGKALLLSAYEKWQQAQKQVEAQQRAVKAAKARYDEGLLQSVELALIQANLVKALSNQVQARYEWHFRKLLLDQFVDR